MGRIPETNFYIQRATKMMTDEERSVHIEIVQMIAGMLPMAFGVGGSGEESAPLGRAVIGGLALATIATLFVVPGVFALLRARASRALPSLHPDDAAKTK